MKIQLNVNDDLQKAANRLSDILGVEFGSGIEVNAVLGDRIGASLKGGVGTIYYRERCHFFRELGVFVENARKSDSFDVTEDGFTSIVISASEAMLKAFFIALNNSVISLLSGRDGVPPPK